MFTRWLAFLICLACATYLAAEVMPRPTAKPSAAQVDPSPSSPKQALFEPIQRQGRDVLDQALRKIKAITWLRVTVWQRLHGVRGFESSAALTLGPQDCAALDLTVNAGGAPFRQRVICDGHAIATIDGAGAAEEDVRGVKLPASSRGRAELLQTHGCVSPAGLMRQVRDAVSSWQVQQGIGDTAAVLRLTGKMDAPGAQRSRWTSLGASLCVVELDAATLWPRRLEWRRVGPQQRESLVLEMEFRDPVVNQPLALDECARIFSYLPAGRAPERAAHALAP